MADEKEIRSALAAIDPSRLNYSEWTQVGMALKQEGLPSSVWDEWSSRDFGRYHPGECERKYETFTSSGIGIGTVFKMAQDNGWHYDEWLDWDSPINDYEEVISQHISSDELQPYEMAIQYLEALFNPNDFVGWVNSSLYKEDRDKFIPANRGHSIKCKELIRELKKYKNLEDVFGTINPEAGAWIRFNPLDGQGFGDSSVTRWDYALVESDTMSIEDQKKIIISLKLPVKALVESGGKSIHAIVKVSAANEQEYKQRVSKLYDELNKHGMVVDSQNSNPSRLSRLPGAERKGTVQKLIATNLGTSSWEEWIDSLSGIDDDLPPLVSLWEQAKDPPKLSPELITGILREGCKMIITGDSKAGKTCLSQNLAVCIAEGRQWLGSYECQKGKVLYINLEVEEASLFRRFRSLYDSLGIKMTKDGASNIIPWNLRGHAAALRSLAPKIISRCRSTGPYKAIIIDPLYKVQLGDENSAEAIGDFTNILDKIAHETGAAIIYDHHHPKGTVSDKKVIDRGAGSGVFSRDADAIVDISNLDPGNTAPDIVLQMMKNGDRPMELSFVLRDFPDISAQKIWFSFPLHFFDSTGILENCHIEGSYQANFDKNPNRLSIDEKRRIIEEAFDACQKDGQARTSQVAAYADLKAETVRRYADEIGGYEIKRGYIQKLDIDVFTDTENK